MKKKVVLVTLQGANIGNRLQNYALQTKLEELGSEVYTPFYDTPELNTYAKRIKEVIKVLLGCLGINRYRSNLYRYKRNKKFREFDRFYIANMFKCKFRDNLYAKAGCELAIVGSDQVWHRWSDDISELDYFYLYSYPKDKRISYAASFGFDVFPDGDVNIHKRYLMDMEYLSCREQKAQSMIYNLTGRNAKVLIDPCLLLGVDKWKECEKKPQGIIPREYVLVYFLGEKSTEYLRAINEFCKNKNICCIDIFDINDLRWYFTTPDEFVWLVEHAQYVFTDSFHACLFSLLFDRKFLAFKRIEVGMEKMFDRIETLLKLFAVDNHIYKGDISQVDIKYEKRNIDAQREEAVSYLKKALNKE